MDLRGKTVGRAAIPARTLGAIPPPAAFARNRALRAARHALPRPPCVSSRTYGQTGLANSRSVGGVMDPSDTSGCVPDASPEPGNENRLVTSAGDADFAPSFASGS